MQTSVSPRGKSGLATLRLGFGYMLSRLWDLVATPYKYYVELGKCNMQLSQRQQ